MPSVAITTITFLTFLLALQRSRTLGTMFHGERHSVPPAIHADMNCIAISVS
jgi:hypothetical protein